MKKTKTELKHVFNDTKRKAWIGNFIKTTTKKVKEAPVVIRPAISVEVTDTVSAATKYAGLGKTCVLNMA